jgi:hypothetical protein
VKFKTADVEEPEFETEAEVPAAPVVVDPTATETTVAPCGPEVPVVTVTGFCVTLTSTVV